MTRSGSGWLRRRRFALPAGAGGRGAALITALAVAAFVVAMVPALSVPHPFAAIAVTLLAAAAVAFVSWVILSPLAALLRRGPAPLAATAGTAAVTLAAVMLAYSRPLAAVALTVATVVPVSVLLGAALGRAAGLLFRRASMRARTGAVLWAALVITAVWWLVRAALAPGSIAHLPEEYRGPAPAPDSALIAPGEYEVRTLSYGSGTDRRRARYRNEAEIVTATVDLAELLPEPFSLRRRYREAYWGFSLQEAPLNGLVWYPDGPGPFPLLVIAHGNHAMEDPSEPGYAYLGRLLASRGFIVVSVDHNFLNMSALGGDWRGKEIGARALLTLEHLALWSEWNSTPEHRFHGRIDLERIALAGHSRGGEAAAAAAMLNRMGRYPEHASRRIPGGHGIRAVVAISPSDGFYRPGGEPIRLSGTDYLVLHGGHDGDTFVFAGLGQYYRTEVDGATGRFKAAVYLYRANHGQFNSRWGAVDLSFPLGYVLNLAPIMAPDEQRQHAALYISAFLEAALREDPTAREVFREPSAPALRVRNEDAAPRSDSAAGAARQARILYADGTARSPSYTTEAEGVSVWRRRRHHSRTRIVEFPMQVTELAWEPAADAGAAPADTDAAGPSTEAAAGRAGAGSAVAAAYHLYPREIPAGASTFILPIADLRSDRRREPAPRPLELEIELETRGRDAVPQLHRGRITLAQPLPVQFTKLGAVERVLLRPAEPLLLPYTVPFAGLEPGPLHPSTIRRVTLRLDPQQSGRLHIGPLRFR